MQPSISDLAASWLELDQDPSTRAEIQALVDSGDEAELELRLRHRIAFGTAGLRASMSAGFARMNSLTVIQASQGLAAYLSSTVPSATEGGVVLGHDARHHSATFARLTAAVFLGRGYKVYWLGQCHTPLVPFTVGKYGAVSGVMVTASHNPKTDNGYKVYWGNGCQIIPPHDKGIAAAINMNLVPAEGVWDENALDQPGSKVQRVAEEAREEYVGRVVKASDWQGKKVAEMKPFTYTPMHGVGLPVFEQMLRAIGLQDVVHVVRSQAEADPEFPTVKFPNPEEKGAMDEAIRVAVQHGDSIIVSNDPDADRFAAAELVDGQWRQLTGNQLGVLLGSYVLEQLMSPSEGTTGRYSMLASTVSSRMLAQMAKVTGKFHFEDTLTGFKWLGNRAQELDKQGYKTLYAYEEAIGFMLSEVVYDKDGIAAAALFLAAIQHWSSQGLTPWSKLQRLYSEFGYFEEANTYLISPSPQTTIQVFEAIRKSSPKTVGGREIIRWRDLTEGYDTATPDNIPTLPVDKSAQMITCELDGGVVFTVRGSGTEPKIKLYIEGTAPTAAEAKHAAQSTLDALVNDWFHPEKNGLQLA